MTETFLHPVRVGSFCFAALLTPSEPRPDPELRGPHLSAVLGDELVLLNRLLDEDAPSGHVGRRQQQVLKPITVLSPEPKGA